MNTFGRYDQPPPEWEPLPEQQHQRGGGAEGTGEGTGGGGGEGGEGGPSGGYGGYGGYGEAGRGAGLGGDVGPGGQGQGEGAPAGGEGGDFGYGAGANPGRGVNPGRGYAGPGEFDTPGGRGRDPGWDKPGGYDYGPNGDVVVRVDPVTGVPSFRVYGQAYQGWFDAQLEEARRTNPVAGAIGTLLANSTMGRAMQFAGRTFGQDINYDGSPVGGHARSDGGGSEEATNRAETERDEDEGGDEDGDEPTTAEGQADQAYRDLLNRLKRGAGTTEWQVPDYGWIYRLTGLEPPTETT